MSWFVSRRSYGGSGRKLQVYYYCNAGAKAGHRIFFVHILPALPEEISAVYHKSLTIAFFFWRFLYTASEEISLCPSCIELQFSRESSGESVSTSILGVLSSDATTVQVSSDVVNCFSLTFVQVCSTSHHQIQPHVPFDSESKTTCWTHDQERHDFFLSYRVASEGKCANSLVHSQPLPSPLYPLISSLIGTSEGACANGLHKALCYKKPRGVPPLCILGPRMPELWPKLGAWVCSWAT